MIGSVLTDKIYTPETCNKKCLEDTTNACSIFGLGRSETEKHGHCFLADGQCTTNNDVNFDIYKSTARASLL